MAETKTRWQRNFLLLLAIGSGLLGLFLILIPYILKWGMLGEILRDVGVALITASLLGSTIEWVFRQRILEDVFKASIGYLLRDELKDEVGVIYNQEILCVKHSQIYSLRYIPNSPDLLILHCKISRDLKNITNKDYRFTQKTSLFEWFHREAQSQIISMGCNVKGETYNEIQTTTYGTNRVEASLPEVIIPKDEICTIWYETEEVKHISDVHYEMFLFPTINPEVTFLDPPNRCICQNV